MHAHAKLGNYCKSFVNRHFIKIIDHCIFLAIFSQKNMKQSIIVYEEKFNSAVWSNSLIFFLGRGKSTVYNIIYHSTNAKDALIWSWKLFNVNELQSISFSPFNKSIRFGGSSFGHKFKVLFYITLYMYQMTWEFEAHTQVQKSVMSVEIIHMNWFLSNVFFYLYKRNFI